MERRPWVLAIVLGHLGTAAALAGDTVVVLTGTDNAAVDRPALQAAVDAANRPTTFLLQGAFQLDGTPVLLNRSDLQFVGQAVDDDGDGLANEDPADGADNDGDGSTDEDEFETVIRGILAPGGAPETGPTLQYNRAFYLRGATVKLSNLGWRNLRFEGLKQAISINPVLPSAPPAPDPICYPQTQGTVDGVQIANNEFVNLSRAVSIFGATQDVTITGNFAQASTTFLVANGANAPCSDGPSVDLPELHRIGVLGNVVQGGSLGVFISGSNAISVSGNTLSGMSFPIDLEFCKNVNVSGNNSTGSGEGLDLLGVKNGNVSGNRFDGGFAGIYLWGDAANATANVTLADNQVSGGVFSIALEATCKNNSILYNTNSGAAGPWLDAPTRGNVVVAEDCAAWTAEDYGQNNTIVCASGFAPRAEGQRASQRKSGGFTRASRLPSSLLQP